MNNKKLIFLWKNIYLSENRVKIGLEIRIEKNRFIKLKTPNKKMSSWKINIKLPFIHETFK